MAVDWWAFGVFLYELLVGFDPFGDSDPMVVSEKILEGKVKFPSKMDPHAKNLIKNLLQVDLSKRYGNLIDGANDVISHKFFSSIDLKALVNMELKPPFVPIYKSNEDISNFSKITIDEKKEKDLFKINAENEPFINW